MALLIAWLLYTSPRWLSKSRTVVAGSLCLVLFSARELQQHIGCKYLAFTILINYIVLMGCRDFGMGFAHGQVVWRFPVAFQLVISLLSIALLFPLPDTPRWYYARKRNEDGDEVLRRLCIATNEREVFKNPWAYSQTMIHLLTGPLSFMRKRKRKSSLLLS